MSSSEPRTTRVSVYADAQAALEVVDGSFHVVARGAGVLHADLPPGIYKARAQAGGVATEKLFETSADHDTETVELDRPEFASPVPLAATSTTHEFHQSAAQSLADGAAEDVGAGTGGGFLFLLRDPRADPNRRDRADRPAYARSFQGFRLRTAEGILVADLDGRMPQERWLGFLGAHLEVSPGLYVLDYAGGGEPPAAMSVHVVDGWRTQLFVNMVPRAGGEKGALRPQLSDRSLSMCRAGEPFDAYSPLLRLSEAVRYSLASGHPAPAVDAADPAADPVLALMMAHLAREEGTEAGRARCLALCDAAAGVLGDDFPDVVALRGGGAQPVSAPPLLRESWDLLARDPQALARGSLGYSVASRLLVGGVWTTWFPDTADSATVWSGPSSQPESPGSGHKRARPVTNLLRRGLRRGADLLGGRILRKTAGVLLANSHESATDDSGAAEMAPQRGKQAAQPTESEALAVFRRIVRDVPWGQIVAAIQRTDAAQRWLASLTPLQKTLLLTLQLASDELKRGDAFTLDELRHLHRGFGIPLPVLIESAADLAARAAVLLAGRLLSGMDAPEDDPHPQVFRVIPVAGSDDTPRPASDEEVLGRGVMAAPADDSPSPQVFRVSDVAGSDDTPRPASNEEGLGRGVAEA